MKRNEHIGIKTAEDSSFFRVCVFFSDMLIIACSPLLALLIRYDFIWSSVPTVFWSQVAFFTPFNIVVSAGIFYLFRMYNIIWRFASTNTLIRVGAAVFTSSIINTMHCVLLGCRLPMSVYCIVIILNLLLCAAVRLIYRLFIHLKKVISKIKIDDNERIMIIGAGDAGGMLINELVSSGNVKARVSCVIDDNPKKQGSYIQGIPIIGGRESIESAAESYGISMIIFAIPSATGAVKEEILNICKLTKCKLLTLPGIYQLVNGEVQISKLREVSTEDLLGREVVDRVPDSVKMYIKGQVVIVTGGGGSIGSELCRQLARCRPRQLLILDIYENNAYEVQMELRREYPELNLVVLIASIRDEARIDAIFAKYRPDIVYHAAAHKHVPLMEENPAEAVKNNVFGTLNTALAAIKYNAKHFVLISTDKAVRPSSIMGATKRICEMIVQALDRKSETAFAAVRFGNVLGSNGSVIPLFKKQIESGGPVTVTHPEVIRYFMTIPEAVSLVLQAGSYAKTRGVIGGSGAGGGGSGVIEGSGTVGGGGGGSGGNIFVLDMGEPVKILELAENLIRLSGYEPYKDIPIVFTGLRPGEKLYEELLMEEEGLQETRNHLIRVARPTEIDEDGLFAAIDALKTGMARENSDIREIIKEIVPGYMYEKVLQEVPREELERAEHRQVAFLWRNMLGYYESKNMAFISSYE